MGVRNCPSGKSVRAPPRLLSTPSAKNISLRRLVETALSIPPSRPTEGRLAIVTNAGRDAMDAFGAQDERASKRTAKSCGPDTPTLVSSG